MLHAWAAAHGQLKLSLTANESNQEAVAFFYQLGTDGGLRTPSGLWLSERPKWIVQFQTVSLQLSVERGLQQGHRASLHSMRVTEPFFPFFVNILFKTILYAILLHCFAHLAFSWFVPPIDNLKLIIFPCEF